jgi:enamine deaminase RidA (YjgF/YER057c/UK114 family)
MIRILSLAAALAVLPLSSALAATDKPAATPKGPAESAIEAAASAFEARMEAFGERAEAIAEDKSLSETQRQTRIAALWSEYQPEVAAFTATVTQHAGAVASAALADIDVEALVAEALKDPEIQTALEGGAANGAGIAGGVVRNSAWTNPDPEQIRTYGLIAQYALDQAADALEETEEAEPAETL